MYESVCAFMDGFIRWLCNEDGPVYEELCVVCTKLIWLSCDIKVIIILHVFS